MTNRFKIFGCILACILLICSSCIRRDVDAEKLGYPSKISIPIEGGTFHFPGSDEVDLETINNKSLYELGVQSDYVKEFDYYYSYQWLSIKIPQPDFKLQYPEIILIAEPNDTGHSRKFIIEVSTGDLQYAEITIEQQGD